MEQIQGVTHTQNILLHIIQVWRYCKKQYLIKNKLTKGCYVKTKQKYYIIPSAIKFKDVPISIIAHFIFFALICMQKIRNIFNMVNSLDLILTPIKPNFAQEEVTQIIIQTIIKGKHAYTIIINQINVDQTSKFTHINSVKNQNVTTKIAHFLITKSNKSTIRAATNQNFVNLIAIKI